MLVDNCNSNAPACTFPSQWGIQELEARSGALVNEALVGWSENVRRVHWPDMKQTAMLAFLEYQDKPAAYAYSIAETALKNYKWVHIRGLNGGWKSLACRGLEVLDIPLESEGDRFDSPSDNIYWRWSQAWEWESVPRPVERQVMWRLDRDGSLTTEAVCRELLTILAGMSSRNWYPEQIYRAAVIISMLMTRYTWEDVEARMGMDYAQLWSIWWHYRRTRLTPFMKLTPLHQELIKLCGRLRLCYFEELTPYLLNQAQRKMVVLPQGIYTITYKRRARRRGQTEGQLEGSLQKGVRINGKLMVRAVSLGAVGTITKERLLTSVQTLARRMAKVGYRQKVMA